VALVIVPLATCKLALNRCQGHHPARTCPLEAWSGSVCEACDSRERELRWLVAERK